LSAYCEWIEKIGKGTLLLADSSFIFNRADLM